jgi:Helix-turn-helix domain of resolvase
MDRGVQFGRKPKLTPHQISEAIRRREAGEALTEIGRSYNVSHSTISRHKPALGLRWRISRTLIFYSAESTSGQVRRRPDRRTQSQIQAASPVLAINSCGPHPLAA